jgi:aspartate aminotransferase-like enzyme
MIEARDFGFDRLAEAQWAQGRGVRAALARRGVKSVAAEGFEAPGVVVAYTDRDDVQTGKAFAEQGVQIAAGVPLQVGEGPDYKSFRIGLFGIDKLRDVPASVARIEEALDRVF